VQAPSLHSSAHSWGFDQDSSWHTQSTLSDSSHTELPVSQEQVGLDEESTWQLPVQLASAQKPSTHSLSVVELQSMIPAEHSVQTATPSRTLHSIPHSASLCHLS
jgi:hypothetical protein